MIVRSLRAVNLNLCSTWCTSVKQSPMGFMVGGGWPRVGHGSIFTGPNPIRMFTTCIQSGREISLVL